MKSSRLLFPFTRGMNAHALDQAVLLAKTHNATLVPVSLLRVSDEKKAKGLRLEYVQQSQDFLEAVQCRAAKCHVPVEKLEVVTSNVGQSIDTLADKMDCEAVLLFTCGKDGVLLDTQEVKQIMEKTNRKLYIFHLESKDSVRVQVC